MSGMSHSERGRRGGKTSAANMTDKQRKARARKAAATRWDGHVAKSKPRPKRLARLTDRRVWYPDSIGFEVDVKDLHLLKVSGFDPISDMVKLPTPPRRTKARPDDIYIPPSSRSPENGTERVLENKTRYDVEREHERRRR